MATKEQIKAACVVLYRGREPDPSTDQSDRVIGLMIDAAVPPLTNEERDAIERCMCRDPDVVIAFRYFERAGFVTNTRYYTDIGTKKIE